MAGIAFGRGKSFVVDSTAPTLQSATIGTDGTTLTLVFSEVVVGNTGIAITPSGGAAGIAYSSGSGTTTLVYGIDRTIVDSETCTIAASSSNIQDVSANALADFSGTSVTNNSTETGGFTTLLSDSFEGGGLGGWHEDWSATTGTTGACDRGLQTVLESGNTSCEGTTDGVAPPTGGGSYTLRQWWHSNIASGWAPEWLQYHWETTFVEGDILEFEFYLMYDANFDFGAGSPTLKMIRLWDSDHTKMSLDWNSHHQGAMAFQMIDIVDQVENWYEANVNGGSYDIPVGEWVHLRCRMKLATENEGVKDGYVHIWVNSVLRWQYDDIWTCPEGKNWGYIENNATFNNETLGADQKQHWDLFVVRKG